MQIFLDDMSWNYSHILTVVIFNTNNMQKSLTAACFTSACCDLYITPAMFHYSAVKPVDALLTQTYTFVIVHGHSHTLSLVRQDRYLSVHLHLISDDMSNAKWEIWISFLCRQSLIHWQKAQMREDDYCDLDLSRSTTSGFYVVLWTGGYTICVLMDWTVERWTFTQSCIHISWV